MGIITHALRTFRQKNIGWLIDWETSWWLFGRAQCCGGGGAGSQVRLLVSSLHPHNLPKREIRPSYSDFHWCFWASLVAQMVKNHLQCGRPGFDPWVGKIPWRRAWQPTPVFLPGESPWTEESGGLQSMGSQRVRHNWVTKHTLMVLFYKWWD